MADMVEISEEELKVLRGSNNLMNRLLKAPETRREQEKLVKKLYPETTTTDDVVEPYVKDIDSLKEELKNLKKELQGEKLDSKLNRDIEYLREQENWTADGIEKLKELMIKEEIPNIRAAAAWWEKQNPPKPAEPSQFAPTDWGFGRGTKDDKDMDLLFKDEDAWAEREAKAAWDEEVRKKGQILT